MCSKFITVDKRLLVLETFVAVLNNLIKDLHGAKICTDCGTFAENLSAGF